MKFSKLKIAGYIIGVVVNMEKIKKVKLGVNPETMQVVVTAEVEMKNNKDKDDLYLIMFNIMDSPLRLSLFTIGNLHRIVKENHELPDSQIVDIMENNPEKYIALAVSDLDILSKYGTENVKIELNNKNNATKARLILSSMINSKSYLQITKYKIDGEEIIKEQEIDTEELIPQLKLMLEITKRWENFNPEEFQKEIDSGKIKLT
tara:strand:+ start:2942 stop:3556 length:615 start_codon:yes stop_codon:yes gene_type:complete